ncbi:hypothetical protein C8Q75DRAFT_111788 [Abortiporus biennis]|nr:hypothetical protein C8Q75DRAFT_111788 [Abortiporus biennis]
MLLPTSYNVISFLIVNSLNIKVVNSSWLRPALSTSSLGLHSDTLDTTTGGETIAAIIRRSELQLDGWNKPDCFRNVAASIHSQCGELELHEETRIQAAISLTICELATAHHTPPLECAVQTSNGHSDTDWIRSQSNCVE